MFYDSIVNIEIMISIINNGIRSCLNKGRLKKSTCKRI